MRESVEDLKVSVDERNTTNIQETDRLIIQLKRKIRKAEVERRLLVTRGNIEALTGVLRDLQESAAKDEQWLRSETLGT